MTQKASLRPSASEPSQSRRRDGDGHAVGNKILLGLSRKEYHQALSNLELVRLKLH
jgi:hypothetical protein